ncbi:hypothetical protein BDR06DRAFT_1023280 [Suillus hirtellus]|nr:hypothetical protein BDR06DRAFT_1023280 [Suillus hirtellus]
MSDRSSSRSSHPLRSRGTIEAAAASGTSHKAPAVWSKAEGTTFLEFLLKALPFSGDGGFKTTTFNQAAIHLKEKFMQQRGAEKTGVVCKNKWTAFKKAYHSVIEIKCTSGFTWSDEHGAGIADRKDDVWARFTKSHPHAKPFISKGFNHFEIMEQLMPNQSKGAHVFWPTATAVSTSVPPATESTAPSAAPPPAGPPSSINPDSIAPPVPSTYLAPSTEGSTTDSVWTSISCSKCKYSALAPGSATSSQKQSRPPSATLMAQQEGTETMKNLVEVVCEMQKNFTLAPPLLPMQQLVQPGTHVGSTITLLNKYTNLTSKERLSIANFLAEHENQAIIFYSLDEATRLEWLEEKRVLCGGAPCQASADSQEHMIV